MKKSLNIWSFYTTGDLNSKLALAKEAGFEGLELNLDEEGPVDFKCTPDDLSAIRKQADSLGIALTGLSTGLYWGANAASANRETREKASAILSRQLQCAHQLGIDTVLVVPGTVGVDFIPSGEIVPYDLAYERATNFIQNALPEAKKLNVKIAVENVWNKFLTSPLEMRAFIDQFNTEYVGAYLDVGNTLSTGYPEHWIRILGEKILRVHFKDYRRAVGSVDGFCDLLSGDVNWKEVMQAFHDVKYSGWIAAEMIPPVPFYKYCPEVLIHNTSRAMSAIFCL